MAAVIDTHCHVSNRWYEPVETLLFQMDRCGVEKAVLVQLLGGRENGAMEAACAAWPDRFTWVAGGDPARGDWASEVTSARDAGASGIRMRTSFGAEEEDDLACWRTVADAGLAVSLVGPAASFLDGRLAQIAEALPELSLVMEHGGGLARPDVGDRAAALPGICALAAQSKISLKLPGLGQLAPRLPSPDASDRPLDLAGVSETISALLDAFGPERMMWGSDFPPVASREGYANALGWTRDLVAELRPDAVDAVFGATANRIWFGP